MSHNINTDTTLTHIPATPIAYCQDLNLSTHVHSGANRDRTAGDNNKRAVHMHLDANRDGIVDDTWEGNNTWEFGEDKKGAIILYNCDSDIVPAGSTTTNNKDRDCDGKSIGSVKDIADIAPLDIRITGTDPDLPSDLAITLSVKKHRDCIHIFNGRHNGAAVIIGKGSKEEYSFSRGDFKKNKNTIELGMEATTFPYDGFSGEITLTLNVQSKSGKYSYKEEATVRAAPWLMSHNLQPVEQKNGVFVANFRDTALIAIADSLQNKVLMPFLNNRKFVTMLAEHLKSKIYSSKLHNEYSKNSFPSNE